MRSNTYSEHDTIIIIIPRRLEFSFFILYIQFALYYLNSVMEVNTYYNIHVSQENYLFI